MSNKQSVLIIEDSPLVVRILTNILEKDYEVYSALTGAGGYELAVEKNPDIIVLDVVMSGMDGYEVCSKLKKNSLTKHIPVIFISALGETEDERKGLEAGAIDYIAKPFSEPIVKIRIKNHLELKRSRDILSELSSLDGLTGLYNRRYFDNAAKQLWQKAILFSLPFSLMLIDIDHFKLYNDNYGHLEGDECLKRIARCIKSCFDNKEDVVARFGGEEFVCIMPKDDINSALAMAQKIAGQVKDMKIPFPHSSVCDIVTISTGVGTIRPDNSAVLSDFIKAVDALMYKAKANGRNQIQYEQL